MKKQIKHIHCRVEEDQYETLLRLARKNGFADIKNAGISRIVRKAIGDYISREAENETPAKNSRN